MARDRVPRIARALFFVAVSAFVFRGWMNAERARREPATAVRSAASSREAARAAARAAQRAAREARRAERERRAVEWRDGVRVTTNGLLGVTLAVGGVVLGIAFSRAGRRREALEAAAAAAALAAGAAPPDPLATPRARRDALPR